MVRFDTNLSDDKLAALLALLIDQRTAVAQFREVPTDLEDAFLTVTRRDQEEAAGAAGSKLQPS
jgi:ABC-2 type transport system ATP-binding protein